MKPLYKSILLITVILLAFKSSKANSFSSFYLQQIAKQDTNKKDSVKFKGDVDTGLDKKIEYKARDSVRMSRDSTVIYLYGNARVIYGDFQLDADYIRYNKKNNLIFASGSIDPKTKKYNGRPIFKAGQEGSAIADSIYYNANTTRAKVFNVFAQQDDGFFSGGQNKKQQDGELHIHNTMYSTCNLPHPHFGLMISKGIVTEKQIITGPVYMIIEDVPTFLALPFAFFPKQDKRTSGFILPTPGEDGTRGFFLQNFGYYLGLNDYWDAKLLGTIYTNGSYLANLTSGYTKRYKFNGNIRFDYANTKGGLEGFEQTGKDFKLAWSHSQNANANPGTIFSANVDLGSSSYNRRTLAGGSYDLNQIASNTMNSSINYSKSLPNGMNYSLSVGSAQTLSTRDISLRLPTATFSVPTFSPFDSKERVGQQKWYQKITLGYSFSAENSISTKDSLLFQSDGLKRLKSGFNHSVPVSLGFTALKYLNFTIGGIYNEVWNFQTIDKRYTRFDDGTYTSRTDTIAGFKRAGSYNISTSLTTKIYGTKVFSQSGRIRAMRHVMTPNISFSYSPDFVDPAKGIYKYAYDQHGNKINDINGSNTNGYKTYSILEQSAYPGSFNRESGSIGFGLDNSVELKVRDKHDTTGTGEKKIPIIQSLSFTGSYNFLAKNYKLSPIGFSGTSQFTDKLSISYRGALDPYVMRDSLNNGVFVTRNRIDRYTWQDKKLPRLSNFGFSFNYSFNSEALNKKNENYDKLKEDAEKKGITPLQSEQLRAISRDPNAFVDFNIPWNFSFTYSFDYTNDGNRTNTSNSLNFNGDFNLTPKWKITFNSGYDFQNKGLTPMNIGIYRDLHCWDMSVNWVPYGAAKMYSVIIRVKSSILQDLKLSKRQGYYNTY